MAGLCAALTDASLCELSERNGKNVITLSGSFVPVFCFKPRGTARAEMEGSVYVEEPPV